MNAQKICLFKKVPFKKRILKAGFFKYSPLFFTVLYCIFFGIINAKELTKEITKKATMNAKSQQMLIAQFACSHAQKNQENIWPMWQKFRNTYMSQEGRIIDPMGKLDITTSEGQSYALFFALIANDPKSFATLLNWTQTHLAQGDLSQHLPAWLWGEKEEIWQIKDPNSASDADLWIAYSLIEAGRLWQNPSYSNLGRQLLDLIIKEESTNIKGLGRVLLPGKFGFSHPKADSQPNEQTDSKIAIWRLNLSYVPLPLIEKFSSISNTSSLEKHRQNQSDAVKSSPQPMLKKDKINPWKDILNTTLKVLIRASPNGLAADWSHFEMPLGFKFEQENIGSYDAIRVYLWIGVLAHDAPYKNALLKHYSKFRQLMQHPQLQGFPPEKVNVLAKNPLGGIDTNVGPYGFSAALLPFLQDQPDLLNQQRQRLVDKDIQKDNYFNSVLQLFGQGFDEGYYFFNRQGSVFPKWSVLCQ